MHFYLGLSDPLVGCLLLLRVLHGVNQTQRSTGSSHIPITDCWILVMYKSLPFFETEIVWCSRVPPLLPTFVFSAPLDLQFHPSSSSSSTCWSAALLWILASHLQINMEASRCHPFQKGCCPCIGMGCPRLCVPSCSVCLYEAALLDHPLSSGQPLSVVMLAWRCFHCCWYTGILLKSQLQNWCCNCCCALGHSWSFL